MMEHRLDRQVAWEGQGNRERMVWAAANLAQSIERVGKKRLSPQGKRIKKLFRLMRIACP